MQSAGCKTAGGGGGGGELSVKGGGRGGGANWLYFLLHFAVSLQLVWTINSTNWKKAKKQWSLNMIDLFTYLFISWSW